MKLTKSDLQHFDEQAAGSYSPPLCGLVTGRNLMFSFALIACANVCFAGYSVDSHIESAWGTNYYSWVVYNEDQSWGLDGFAIEVPVETRVLLRTVPQPHANPDQTAYWVMEERNESWVDPHDARVIIPEPRRGMKWLWWWGMESPSVYPPGTSVTFSVATDTSVGPGPAAVSAVTYTPQNNPHYYLHWRGQVIGPSGGTANETALRQAQDSFGRVLPSVRSSLVTNLEGTATSQKSTVLPATSIALHVAVTVEGEVGSQYGIQFKTNLSDTNRWQGVANVLLSTPKQVWYDPEPATNPQRNYRVVPGPISIP